MHLPRLQPQTRTALRRSGGRSSGKKLRTGRAYSYIGEAAVSRVAAHRDSRRASEGRTILIFVDYGRAHAGHSKLSNRLHQCSSSVSLRAREDGKELETFLVYRKGPCVFLPSWL